jgi:hypothetical protein
LLTEWAGQYRAERNAAREYYSLKPIPQTEAELSEAKVQLAFTGFSGAVRFAPQFDTSVSVPISLATARPW